LPLCASHITVKHDVISDGKCQIVMKWKAQRYMAMTDAKEFQDHSVLNVVWHYIQCFTLYHQQNSVSLMWWTEQ
jgi:hypothetical protein